MKIGFGIHFFFNVKYTDNFEKLALLVCVSYSMVFWCLYETPFVGHLLRRDYQPLFGKVRGGTFFKEKEPS